MSSWVGLLFPPFQLEESLAPQSADPNGYWKACILDRTKCNASQIQAFQGIFLSCSVFFSHCFELVLRLLDYKKKLICLYNVLFCLFIQQAGFRNQMLSAIKDFLVLNQSGLYINSHFIHCLTEDQGTWFSDNSPVLEGKVQIY